MESLEASHRLNKEFVHGQCIPTKQETSSLAPIGGGLMTMIDTSLIPLIFKKMTKAEERAWQEETYELWRESWADYYAKNGHTLTDAKIKQNGHIATDAERMRETRRTFLTLVLVAEKALASVGNGNQYAHAFKLFAPDPPPPAGRKAKRRATRTYWSQEIADLVKVSGDQSRQQNCYLGEALSDGERSDMDRVKGEDFTGLLLLSADVDILGPAHAQTRLPVDVVAAQQIIAAFGLPPSLIVSTGHGLQPLYLLKVPWTWDATDKDTRARALRLLKAWGEHVQAVSNKLGYTIDNTADAARVVRIPGTTNFKWAKDGTPLPPVEATLDSVSDVRYTVEELEAFLGLSDTSGDEEKTSDEEETSDGGFSDAEEAALTLAVKVLAPGRRWERVGPFVGMLCHGGMSEESATKALEAICDRCPGIDRARELKTLRNTYRLARENKHYSGTPTLAKLLGHDWVLIEELRAAFGLAGAKGTDEFYVLTDVQAQQLLPSPGLIGKLLFANTTALLYSEYGAWKTYLALDFALSLGFGKSWLGLYDIEEPRDVVYVCSEGEETLGPRISAWKKQHGVDLMASGRLTIVADVVDMLDPTQVEKLIATIDKRRLHPAMIVLDTVAWAMIGGEENGSKDVGKLIAAMRKLRTRYHSCCLGIHHSGKDPDKGTRGSSAFGGNVDTVMKIALSVDADNLTPGDQATLINEKMKNGFRFDSVPFTTFACEVPLADGSKMTELSIVSHGGGKPKSRAPESPSLADYNKSGVDAWKALNKWCARRPDGATFTEWRETAMKTGGMAARTFAIAVTKLTAGGWVVRNPTDADRYISSVPKGA